MRLSFTFLLFFALSYHCFAQKTIVYGRVVEATSGSPISFANVFFKNTTIGTYTDEVGNYLLETTEPHDSLQITALGYIDTIIGIRVFRQREIQIELSAQNYSLSEIEIIADQYPAHEILREVVANKPQNDPEKFDAYEYRSYNKIQFDLNNFSDKIKKNFLFKPFPFVWQYQDSMPNGVRYLPFLLKENVRQHYYRKKPKSYKEYLIATNEAQFFKGPKIEEFIEELYLKPNIYENFVVILGKSFPSPIHDNFQRHYKYFLNDTLQYLDGIPCHHIRFIPKGVSDVAFTGDIYVHDSTYAVKRVDLNFSIDANVNFVRSFWLRMDYDWLEQTHWFLKESKVLADFTVVENAKELTGFFGRRSSEYKNIIIDQPQDNSIYAPIETIIETDSIALVEDTFWASERSDTLSEEEQDIFVLVDTIEKTGPFKFYKKLFGAVLNGWIPYDGVDVGDVYSFYSYNDVEGSRFKLGIRTSKKNNFPLQAQMYAAYGLRDHRWKYLADLSWKFGKKYGEHLLIGASYKQDVDQIGRSYNSLPLDHFLTYLIQVAPFDNRTFVRDQKAYLERQWFLGFVTRATVFNQKVEPFGNYDFLKGGFTGEPEIVPDFTLAGWKISGRFAYGENSINAKFYDRESSFFMLKYPVVSFEFTAGIKDFWESDFDYQRLNFRVEHQQRLNKLGYLSYVVEAGKIWGEVPYPFLAIPFGSQAVWANRVSFNMMNYMEFASDQYVALHLEHHFEGLIFNKIPWVRKLKLRLFVFGKVFAGKLSAENNEGTWRFPDTLFPIDEPYMEAGFGIENIIKFGRIDLTWRLNYLDHPDIYRVLPKPSFQIRF